MTLSIPYSFVPGTKAKAQEVNANFNAVVEQIDDIDSLKLNKDCSNLSAAGATNLHSSLTSKVNVDCDNLSDTAKISLSQLSMPSSSKYVDLTLGPTNTEYTAPSNGWIYFCKVASAANQYIGLENNTAGRLYSAVRAPSAVNMSVYVPCSQGDTVKVGYNATGETQWFRFVYANGSESEAS